MEIAIVISWIIFSFVVASIAKKKGRSWSGYFFLSLIVNPLISFIVLLILGDSDELRLEKIKQEEETRITIRNDLGDNPKPISSANKYESLEKLGGLLEKGIVSKEEFEEEKKKILSDTYANSDTEVPIQNKENNIDINSITTLKKLIDKEKNKGIFGKSIRTDIIDYLSKCCDTKDKGLMIIKDYNSKYNSDLIEDLKKLTTSYDGIKESVGVFIDLEIVNEKYPHEIK